jgi:hypothetical protein
VARTGRSEDAEGVRALLEKLHENCFLEGPRFERRIEEIRSVYARSPVRPAAHAGAAYPSDPYSARQMLAGLFDRGRRLLPRGLPPERPAGLIVPHIDPRRGGAEEAAAYSSLSGATPPDVFIVFGTAHWECREQLAFTAKDFDTPLGRATTDAPLVRRLAAAYGKKAFDDEFSHRREHSIEFQVLYLQFAFGAPSVRIVPILCGPLPPGDGASDPRVAAVADEIGKIRREFGHRVMLISGGDLSHVGLRFGDRKPPDQARRAEIERFDRQVLEVASTGSAEAFRRRIADAGDATRICGLPPDYWLLRCGGFTRGRVLCYRQSDEPETGSLVSFASVALW